MAPTWDDFFLAIPIGMIAYTGIETVSNLAEEVRDPARNVPRAYLMTAVAVFAIFFTLPADRPLGAARHRGAAASSRRCSACLRRRAASPTIRCSGSCENLGARRAACSKALQIYVGVLAATILFIAANAGVIGASRITYAMAGLPAAARTSSGSCTAGSRRRGSRSSSSPGSSRCWRSCSRASSTSWGRCTRSARCSRSRSRTSRVIVIAIPEARRGAALPAAAEHPLAWGRLAAVRASSAGSGRAHRVARRRLADAQTRCAGLGWLALGFVGLRDLPALVRPGSTDRDGARAGDRPGRAARGRLPDDRRARCCARPESEEALVAAARLAADRRSRIALVNVIEVPLDRALDADMHEAEAEAERVLDDAEALLESYGVRTVTRVVRARAAGPAIVEDALGARRRADRRRRAARQDPARQADLRPHRRLRAEAQPDPRPRRGGEASRVITRGLSVVLRRCSGSPCSCARRRGIGGGLGSCSAPPRARRFACGSHM